MSREIKLAVVAGKLALQDAKLYGTPYDQSRIGWFSGRGIINNDLDEIGTGFRNAIDGSGRFSMAKFGQEGVSLFLCGS